MKRTLQILCIGLLSLSFVAGCKKEEEAVEEPVVVEEPTEQAELVEETEEQLAEEAAEEGPDEGMFIRAAYEVTCVRTKIEDPEEQNAVLAEVYPRYGFTPESFSAMEGDMADKETVKIAITERMKVCTVEMAQGFKTAGAADGAAAGEAPAGDAAAPGTAKPAGPSYKTGTLKAPNIGGGGIEGGELTLRVGNDGKVTGVFRGKREGKGFSIPLRGNVVDGSSLTATGSVGQNKVQIDGGRITKNGATGTLTGQINQNNFKSSFTAQ